ncbi:hypothetical protein E3T40_01735 [Cryobacterium sp. TMT1-19]|uniref:hypothetical protein n=1 Tax=Cryobacterium sp. TMT1-19 TaxID=1259231 RepID=UPI00106B6D7A|nr:hypothetical protein [Cryobacterium sp. TMT1-19]TFD39218.1 hypothetical protein E3T40_01735 [Cryobacterium sp. TMT1-19]
MALIMLILQRKQIWGKPQTSGNTATRIPWRTLGTMLVAVAVGSSNSYYAFVTVILVSMVGVAMFIGDRNWRRLGGHLPARTGSWARLRCLIVPLAALIILPVGLLDQTSPQMIPDYPAVSAAYSQDASFVRELESKIPTGSSVLQLPYSAYLQSGPVNGVVDSGQIEPFLHSAHLKWSGGAITGGAIKGRPTTDWPALSMPRQGLESTLIAASLRGFNAVVIDRQSLGDDQDAVAAETSRVLGDSAALIIPPRYLAMSLETLRQRSVSQMSSAQIALAIDRTFFPVVAALEPNLRSGFNVNADPKQGQ